MDLVNSKFFKFISTFLEERHFIFLRHRHSPRSWLSHSSVGQILIFGMQSVININVELILLLQLNLKHIIRIFLWQGSFKKSTCICMIDHNTISSLPSVKIELCYRFYFA